MHFSSERKFSGKTDRVFIEIDFSVEQLKAVGPTGMKEKANFLVERSINGWADYFNVVDPDN